MRFLPVSGPGQLVVAPGAGHTLDTAAGPRMLNMYPTLKIWSKPRRVKSLKILFEVRKIITSVLLFGDSDNSRGWNLPWNLCRTI